MNTPTSTFDQEMMRRALRLARRAYGFTSPNPMVGAVLTKDGRILGQGWHHQAGEPHAEIEALQQARLQGRDPRGATLYVTLEPCCTQGRTPPCTEAILQAGIARVVVAATDPNPAHSGRAYALLSQAGVKVSQGLLAESAERLNEAFHHWIVRRAPWVIVKSAMTLDGKIATAQGESRWITGPQARQWSQRLRQGVDAILVGINTVLADDPSLTLRSSSPSRSAAASSNRKNARLRRIILDSQARTPLTAQLVTDPGCANTRVVVSSSAPARRLKALADKATVWICPARGGRIDLPWLLNKLGEDQVTSLLVEGGGEVNAAFLEQRLVQRVVLFYAPKILGGREAIKAVAGRGAQRLAEVISLRDLEWRRLGPDLMLTGRVG